MQRIIFSLATFLFVSISPCAFAQQTILQGGPWVEGHVPMYVGSGGTTPIVQDSGSAAGGGPGLGLSELAIASRGTGSGPFPDSGTGPLNSHWCMYDGPITSPSGYHYFCIDPNAQGGGLLAYGAAGTALQLPLNLNVNGANYQFPFTVGGIVGPNTTTVGDFAIWNNTGGSLLSDPGISLSALQASIALKAPLASPAFTGTPTAPTPSAHDNSTKLATTAYVDGEIAPLAPLASPAFTGTPTAPTPSAHDNSTKLATTAYVDGENGNVGVNVLAFGADSTGTNDSTAAFSAAVAASSGYVNIPCGVYKLNLTLTNLSNTTIAGNGYCSALEQFSSGNLLTLSGGNFNTIRDLQFLGSSSKPGSAIVESNGNGNTKLKDLLVQEFTAEGVFCDGTSGTPMSGNDVDGGYYLSNGINIQYGFCDDFRLTGLQSGLASTEGIHIDNSNAGQINNNFIWSSGTVDLTAINSAYDWISDNRITQAGLQGMNCAACSFMNINGNQFYQNSNTTIGSEPSLSITTTQFSTVEGNNFFDWTSIAHVNYHITTDAASTHVNITGNVFQPATATIAPTNYNSSAVDVMANNNIPVKTNVNNCTQPGVFLAGATTTSSGGSGSTIFLGAGGGNSVEFATWWLIPRGGSVCTFAVSTTTSPGSGQTYNFNVHINGAATSISGQITGSGQSVTVAIPSSVTLVSAGQPISIQETSSGGAANANFQYSVGVSQ